MPLTTNFFFSRLRTPIHPLMGSKFCDSSSFVAFDGMHICDCNGVANIVAGSTMRHLIEHEQRLGNNQEARMESINQEKELFYKNNLSTHRMPPLKLSNLTGPGGWALLKGPVVKALNTRCLAPFLAHIAEKYFKTRQTL